MDWTEDDYAHIQTIPALYNTDPTSDDFGKISVGGNNSIIDATAFASDAAWEC
jgi:hypothetical protein